MWPLALAAPLPWNPLRAPVLSCSHSCLASPTPGRASFSELGSHRVNLDLPYLGGLKSFQQPPITAGVVGRVKEPAGNISASHSHNMPAAAKLGPVSCVLEAVPRLLSRGPRLLGLGPRELSPFTSSNEISSSLGTSLGPGLMTCCGSCFAS